MEPVPAPAEVKGRKHPRLAINNRGEVVFVWPEATGWQRGGSFARQLYDRSGRPTSDKGAMRGIPAWSFSARVINPKSEVWPEPDVAFDLNSTLLRE
jgi:hypothetical protein